MSVDYWHQKLFEKLFAKGLIFVIIKSMDPIITARGIKLTNSLKAHVKRRASKFFKFHPKILKISYELNSEIARRGVAQDFFCQIKVAIPKKIFFVQKNAGDMYLAVDEASAQMERDLRKNKERYRTLRSRGLEQTKRIVRGISHLINLPAEKIRRG